MRRTRIKKKETQLELLSQCVKTIPKCLRFGERSELCLLESDFGFENSNYSFRKVQISNWKKQI